MMKIKILFFVYLGAMMITANAQSLEFRIYNINTGKEITDYTANVDWGRTKNVVIETGDKKYYFDHPVYEYKYVVIYLDTLNPGDCIRYTEVGADGSGVSSRTPLNQPCDHFHIYKAYEKRDISPTSEFELRDFTHIALLESDLYFGLTGGYNYHAFGKGLQLKYMTTTMQYLPVIITLTAEDYYMKNDQHATDIGVTVATVLFGAGLHAVFDSSNVNYYLRPEIGVDIGVFKFAYGYNITLENELELLRKRNHSFSVGLALNLTRPITTSRLKFPWAN